MIRTKSISLSEQIEAHCKQTPKETRQYDGEGPVISTGSTLLDLAISGGRYPEGGIPFGVMVEIFGPSGSGKTVLLSEIAGNIHAAGGNVMFHDPEARLNKQFARMFGLDLDAENVEYTIPNTIPEVFRSIREWEPGNKHELNVICADSLAALSTDLEMENKEGDKMGMRRAKEFSEELRKTCRIIQQKNLLLLCSNQVRVNHDAGPYGQKYISPGGEAIGFYSSLRLRVNKPSKGKDVVKVFGKEVTRVTHSDVEIEVYKSSVWKPYRTAPMTIYYDYGIDDIRQNLKFIKQYSGLKYYSVGSEKLAISLDDSVQAVEEQGLEQELKKEVIALWNEIESKFDKERKPKRSTGTIQE